MTWLLYNALASLPLFLLAWLLGRRASSAPGVVHLLWCCALLRLLFPPVDLWLAGDAGSAATAVFASGTSNTARELVAWMSTHFGNNWSVGLMRLLLGLWLGGALWVLGRELFHALRLRRVLQDAAPASAGLVGRLCAVASRLGVSAPPVRVLPGIASPFLWSPPWGAGRARSSTLVVPAEEVSLPDSVLAHELVHLRRRDPWAARLGLVVVALFWWNPLAWVARRRAQLSAELACDAEVLRAFPGERGAYARCLIEALERELEGAAPHDSVRACAARAIGWSGDELAGRVERILGPALRTGAGALWKLAAVGLLVLTLPGLVAPTTADFHAALPSIPSGLPESRCLTQLEAADARLAADPADGEAWMQRGRALMGLGDFAAAVEAFEASGAHGHRPATSAYNAACACALLGRSEEALDHLERALAGGIPAEYLPVDPDLASLRGLAGFERLYGVAHLVAD